MKLRFCLPRKWLLTQEQERGSPNTRPAAFHNWKYLWAKTKDSYSLVHYGISLRQREGCWQLLPVFAPALGSSLLPRSVSCMYHPPNALWWWKSTAKCTAKKAVSKGLVHPIAKGLSEAPFMAVELRISEKFLIYPSNFHSTFALPLPIFLCMVHGQQTWQINNFFFLSTGICNRTVKIARKGECMSVEAPEGTRRERNKRMTSLANTAHHEDPRTSINTWFLNNTKSGKTKDTLRERIDHSPWRGWQETQREKRVCQQCCLKILRGQTRWRHTIHNWHPETSPWLPNTLTKCFFSFLLSRLLHTKGGQSSPQRLPSPMCSPP